MYSVTILMSHLTSGEPTLTKALVTSLQSPGGLFRQGTTAQVGRPVRIKPSIWSTTFLQIKFR